MRPLVALVILHATLPNTLHAQVQFHHLALNTTDPESAIRFYTSHFDCERGKFDGKVDAVKVQKSWLLFNKVKQAPAASIESAIWHFGWGAEDMKKTYAAQLEKGTQFDTPLTDISDLARVPGFYYAYVSGPDGALIELNTAAHHRFGHLHLFSADPVAAAEWWAKHFGVKWPSAGRPPIREKRMYREFQVGPSANFMVGDVNVIIYPLGYLKGRTALVSTQGRVVDHVGLAVPDLSATLAKLRQDGVRVIAGVKKMKGTSVKVAVIEGPDKLAIQLVEQRTGQ